jgi:alkylhydroperoxidase/carboxymuconolactone decarboxylase family protein YurZ
VLDYKTTLRRLALRDDRYIEALLAREGASAEESGLDPRARALVQIGALVAVDAAPPSYMSVAEEALGAGATYEELVGALLVLVPVVGVPRVVSAAPNLGLAIGYDVGDALEVVVPGGGAESESGAVA